MKLHLRDLFWLVLVCALGCAWWITYRDAREARTEAERTKEMFDALLVRLEEVQTLPNRDDGSYSGTLIEVVPTP